VKVVNEGETPQRVNLQISGAKTIASKGEAVVLAANKPSDTNSLNEPNNVVPHMESVTDFGPDYARELPPYSITVLKLKAK
jgi:alpha-L-arabinofuranosidase